MPVVPIRVVYGVVGTVAGASHLVHQTRDPGRGELPHGVKGWPHDSSMVVPGPGQRRTFIG